MSTLITVVSDWVVIGQNKDQVLFVRILSCLSVNGFKNDLAKMFTLMRRSVALKNLTETIRDGGSNIEVKGQKW